MAEPDAKPVLQLKSQKFREAREADWKRLSRQLDRVEQKGLKAMSADELLDLPVLYRQAVSSLSMAQSISLDRNLITYLQGLSARAYVFIYGPQTRLKTVLKDFFISGWPVAVRKIAGELAFAFLTLVAGFVAAWLLCVHDSAWYSVLIPSGQAQGRDLAASAHDLRQSLGDGGDTAKNQLAPFAVMLMTHNTGVAISCFALGAIFGLPTFVLTFYTGATMGAMIWLFAQKGLGFEFAAWLTIHGTTEIFALLIAAACGFHIARRLMFPGDATRKSAVSAAGRLTGTAMIGVAVMLTVAGCWEGIGRQTILDPWWRIGIGLVMLILWCSYYLFVGRPRPNPQPKGEGHGQKT
ncbi:stage II sporulation protein M [Asticcacaulis sp. EMRT-3]|uniref:stage II sporulation protein M n=1 Tax=Asticcacaulis sp. EMRT-3 TaxID=3040349 RepID=UPI0024AF2267|nr:stage II sporulation protein M [Asticcacaulis sp. EMRT-3]MDI7776507.1 stage II sporulation protein M [Asticcacaulis sp. EMRT-3]